MKQQLLLLFILFAFSISPLMAQEEIPPATVKNIEKIFEHAREGYDKLNGWELLKAANILIKNPQIQDFKMPLVNQSETEEETGFHKDFFDPEKILEDARKMTPVDAKLLKLAISKLEKDIPNYREMEIELIEKGGVIQVKNYMIGSKNSKTIKTKFNSNEKVTLSVRVGNDLRLSVFDAEKQKVGSSKFIGDARMLSFTAEAEGEHQIKIENVSSQSHDCLLMIETR